MSAISFPEPALAAEVEEHAQPRRARRWYRQPALAAGMILLAIILFAAIAAPLLTSYNPLQENLNAQPAQSERASLARHRPDRQGHVQPAALWLAH